MSLFLGPLFVGMLAVAAPATDRPDFEAIAGRLQFFSARHVMFDRHPERWLPRDWEANWKNALAAIASPTGDVPDLVRLLEHKDPKVRTLALAALFHREDPKLLPHLAALMRDEAKTFPALLPFARGVTFNKEDPPPLQDQTVGQVARQFVRFWVGQAEKVEDGFAGYWAARKDRPFCAGWFQARLHRAAQNDLSLDPAGAERVRALRKDLERLPPVDRDWTLLWLVSGMDNPCYDQVLQLLTSKEELLQAGQRLGPDRLMNLIEGKEISTDPDLGTGSVNSRASREILSHYLLKRAGRLLRPEDAPRLLALEKTLHTPWCAIAAADVQPDSARKVLHEALGRFSGPGSSLSWERAQLAAALWRLGGEPELGFLVDWFYGEKVDLNPCTTQTQLFLDGIAGVRAPADRKLLARLIADPRLDGLDYQSLRGLVLTVNRWTSQPLLDTNELYHSRYWRGEEMKGLVEWRRKLKASVPEWNK